MRPEQIIQGTEGAALYADIPFSDRSAMYAENEAMTQAVRALDIDRLANIKQLGLKNLTTSPDREDMSFYRNPTGNRLTHTLTAALVAVDIATNLGLSDADIAKLRIATLLHDRKMPALGDATQSIDKFALDEERFWDEDLPEEAWKFIVSHGANRDEIHAIINNEGPLGEILNIADRVSYVMGDLQDLNRPPLDYKLGNIYKELAIDPETGQIYFTNPKRLRQFLMERTWLFGMFYLDDPGQAKDFAIASMISEFYVQESQDYNSLNPRRLRLMTDDDLINYLAEKFGVNPQDFHDPAKWPLKYTRKSSLAEARRTLEEINANDKHRGLGIKKSEGFKPSTELRVWDEFSKTHVPASDLFSCGTSPYIDKVIQDTSGYLIIYTDVDNQGLTQHIQKQRII